MLNNIFVYVRTEVFNIEYSEVYTLTKSTNGQIQKDNFDIDIGCNGKKCE